MKKVKFIYNPNSGERRIGNEIDKIIETYQKYNYSVSPFRLSKDRPISDAFFDIDCDYDHDRFMKIANGLENEPERGKRCLKCYNLRMEYTAKKAEELSYDYFATTLTLSPLKDSQAINKIGYAISKRIGVSYLPSDFKKQNGYQRSIELSKEYNLYRQNFCGCIYSKRNIGDIK